MAEVANPAPLGTATAAESSTRPRSSSIKDALQYMANPPANHRLSQADFKVESDKPVVVAGSKKKRRKKEIPKDDFTSRGFFNDLYTMRWMRIPESSLKIILTVISLYFILELGLPAGYSNPLAHALFISHPLPESAALLPGSATTSHSTPVHDLFSTFSLRRLLRPEASPPKPLRPHTHYGKGPLDCAFLAFYIIVFSFVRQSVTEWVIRPAARKWGIRSEGKMHRVMEQGYAVFYFAITSSLGLLIMSKQDSWWYQTEHLWRGYPHWKLDPYTKYYYLLQLSYWLQQMLVLVLRIEKPRPDFFELIIHHIVTLWLVGWSYTINLTVIGVAIFVSMDVPDVFLAFAKCINYMSLQKASDALFVVFLGAWTYFRHYQNLRILYSVWYEMPELLPAWSQKWDPKNEIWMVWWMKYHVFAPILLLQFVNLFWYYLILRVLFRILRGTNAVDVREMEEEEEEKRLLEAEEKEKAKKAQ